MVEIRAGRDLEAIYGSMDFILGLVVKHWQHEFDSLY